MRLNFETGMEYQRINTRKIDRKIGCYVVYTKSLQIPYPKSCSRIIYIGVSKIPSSGMRQRLESHMSGGNRGIYNYNKEKGLMFTYQEIVWDFEGSQLSEADLEKFLIIDFADKYGCYPMCNARSEGELKNAKVDLEINWERFE